MNCDKCGAAIPAGGQFCTGCGSPLTGQSLAQMMAGQWNEGTDQPPRISSDSPLAANLPPWDLVPLHTLLVRRRSVSK